MHEHYKIATFLQRCEVMSWPLVAFDDLTVAETWPAGNCRLGVLFRSELHCRSQNWTLGLLICVVFVYRIQCRSSLRVKRRCSCHRFVTFLVADMWTSNFRAKSARNCICYIYRRCQRVDLFKDCAFLTSELRVFCVLLSLLLITDGARGCREWRRRFWLEADSHVVHASPDARIGKGIPLQPILDASTSSRTGRPAAAHRATDQDLVSEQTNEVETRL